MERLYLCNKQKCEDCTYPQCKHTPDENFALNKIRRERKYTVQYSGDRIVFIEKETK